MANSKTKHTELPWKAVGAFVMSESGVDICSTTNVNQLPLEEAIANAELIAGLGKMHEACKAALAEFEAILLEHAPHLWNECGERPRTPIERQLCEAIALAK